MLFQKGVKIFDYPIVFLFYLSLTKNFLLIPLIIVIKALLFCPVLRKPIPCDFLFFFIIRSPDPALEFPQPFTFWRSTFYFFQCAGSGIFCPAQRRDIVCFRFDFGKPFGKVLRFPPPLIG